MKKLKAICSNIIIFVVAMGVCILPSLMFRTEDEMNTLFRQPEYWALSTFIAAIVTWQVVQAINNSKK
jgi:hypothetical protein